MRFLSTSTCCFCVDLRTGGLVIGVLSLLGSLSSIAAGWGGVVACVIGSIIWGTWLFGIYKQKTNWMLPGLISAIAGLCLLIVVTVYAVVTLWAYCFVFAILTVMQWNFASVVYSLYTQMKETGQQSSTMDPA